MRPYLALLLALLVTRAGASDAPFLWQVQGSKATHYLMGSVHMLPPSAHPLPVALDQAYASTRGLVLETDPAALAAPETQSRMLASGTAEQGLRQEISPALYQRVQRHAQQSGLPPGLCDRFKAWMCGLSLGLIEFQRAGMDPGLGLDHHYYKRALWDSRAVGWLEAPEQQLAIFSGMSAAMAEQFLQSAIEDLARPELSPEALVRMWRDNDTATLARMIEQTRAAFPDTHARLLSDRNRAWMQPLVQRLDGEVPQLVIVGAAHLVGPQGLVAGLTARGYRVRAVSDEGATRVP